MKRFKQSVLVLAITFLVASMAFAGPYLVCDPYPATGTQPTDFSVVMDGGSELISPAQTLTDGTKRLHYDLAGIATGSHSISIKALVVDSTWGRLESSATPFSFSKPATRAALSYKIREVGDGYVLDQFIIMTNPSKAQRKKGVDPEVIMRGDAYGEYDQWNDEIKIHLDREIKELNEELNSQENQDGQ